MPPIAARNMTRRRLLRLTGGMLGLTGAAWLAACGGLASGVPTASAPPAASRATTTPAASSGAASSASTAPALDGTAAPSAAPTMAAMPPHKGIPQGRTPEGFFFLGAAAAPVTLSDYSDFL